MRQSGSVYSRPAPVPKMPPGLVELMEGLTKEVLKHSPPDVYEFCANHMQKLLEIRDGPSRLKPIPLDKKIKIAQEVVRKRSQQRWRSKDDIKLPAVEENNSKILNPIHHDKDLANASEIEISCHPGDETSEKTTKDNESDNTMYEPNEERKQANLDDSTAVVQVQQDEERDKINKDTDSILSIDTISSSNKDTVAVKVDEPVMMREAVSNYNTDSFVNLENIKQALEPVVEQKVIEEAERKVSSDILNNKGVDVKEISKNDEISQEVNHSESKSSTNTDDIARISTNNESHVMQEAVNNSGVEIYVTESEKQLVEIDDDISTDDKEVYRNEEEQNETKSTEEMPEVTTSQEKQDNDIALPLNDNLNTEINRDSVSTEENIETDKKEEIVALNTNTEDQLNVKNTVFNIPENASDTDGGPNVTDIVNVNHKIDSADIGSDIETVTLALNNDVKPFADTEDKSNNHQGNESPVQSNVNVEITVEDNLENVERTNVTDIILPHHQSNEAPIQNDENMVINVEDNLKTVERTNVTDIVLPLTQKDQEVNAEDKIAIQESSREPQSDSDPPVGNMDGIQSSVVDKDSNDAVSKDLMDGCNKQTSEEDVSDHSGESSTLKSERLHDNLQSEIIADIKGNLEMVRPKRDIQILIDANEDGLKTVVEETSTDKASEVTPVLDDCTTEESNSINSIVEGGATDRSDETVQNDNSNTMDLETAAVTIQKVFRTFLFKSRASTFDDSANDDNNLSDDENNEDNKDSRSFLPQTLNKDRRTLGISRMDTVLQTVNEEKSLSISTDDSSTLSSAATIIQAHVRGFLVRNKLHSGKTVSSANSLINSDGPATTSLEGDVDQNKSKTVLNIHIVPEGNNFLSRDESMITSMDLSLDGSPPSSVNLHPLGYDKSERRKQLKREDAIQSVSPPSNNSGKLSEDVDSVKEVASNNESIANASLEQETAATLISEDGTNLELKKDSLDTTPTNSITVETVIDNFKPNTEMSSSPEPVEEVPDKTKKSLTKQSSDEMDVVTPYKGNTPRDSETSSRLLHSGEFHDVVLPTKVSRGDTPVVSEFKNVLMYFLLWNNS